MARALRTLSAIVLYVSIAAPIHPQNNRDINHSFKGENVSLAQANDLEIQRLNGEIAKARVNSERWDSTTNAVLWIAALVAIGIAVLAIGASKAKGRLINLQDGLAKAKDTQIALYLQAEEEKLEKEREARIELEAGYAPRRILKVERSVLATRLKPFAGQTVSLWFHAGDREGLVFASDIGSALETAQWNVYAPASILDLAESGRHGATVVATGITVSSTGDEKSQKASEAIVRQFDALGFDATKGSTNNIGVAPAVSVTVETRPEGRQGTDKLNQQITHK